VAYMIVQVLYKTGAQTDSRNLVHVVLDMMVLVMVINALFWM